MHSSSRGKPVSGNESRYFSAALAYGAEFGPGQGLRPHIRVEMSFEAPALCCAAYPLTDRVDAKAAAGSAVIPLRGSGRNGGRQAERTRVACPRTRSDPGRRRPDDHPAPARPGCARTARRFGATLCRAGPRGRAGDAGGGGETASGSDPPKIFAEMLQRLESDPLWAREYEEFVRQVSFAGAGADASAACARLVTHCAPLILPISRN